MNKYLKALHGLCWSAGIYAMRKRSLGELEYASCIASSAISKIPSEMLRSIPMVWLNQIIEHPIQLNLCLNKGEDGSLPLEDLIPLLYLLSTERPSIIFEIGTFMGHTTRTIAENCLEATIHTLDLPPNFDQKSDTVELPKDDHHLIRRRIVGREFIDRPCAARIHQHFGDSAIWDFNNVKDATFFFIDGAHTYEYIKNDTEKCFEICKGSGTFVWHDVDDRHSGVVRYLAELRQSGIGLKRFANTQLAYYKKA